MPKINNNQNGTVKFGFPVQNQAVQSESDFSDFVTLNYVLKEVLLSPAGVPATVLQIEKTPRPITFPGRTPTPTQPKDNEMTAQLALFEPGISTLDGISQNFLVYPYSYTTAAKIMLEPNCVASDQCAPESAFSPFFTSSIPTYNSFQVFPNNSGESGTAVLQFLWGQKTYTSIPAQYDFTGTEVSFTDSIELALPTL